MLNKGRFALFANKRLIALLSPRRLALLVGAGISVPSGLPSGMQFNCDLLAALRLDRRSGVSLRRLLITGDEETGIRFEQIIECLTSCSHTALQVLDIFDSATSPTYLHYCVASAAAQGAAIFTTNFDSLIESAFVTLQQLWEIPPSRHLRPVYVEEGTLGERNFSFRAFGGRTRSPSVFKLHGTLRRLTAVAREVAGFPWTDRRSIQAVLTRIGNQTGRLGLEPNKRTVLRRHLLNRTLLVAGYSGLDDFDVLPSLCEAAPLVDRVIWIGHCDCPARVDPDARRIPSSFKHALDSANVPYICILGRTDSIIHWLNMSHARFAPSNQLSLALKTTVPWLDDCSAPERHLFLGMLFQEAGDLIQALPAYSEAARLAIRRRSFSLASTSKRKIAHVHRIQGRYAPAVAALKGAIALDQRRDRRGLADDYSLLSTVYYSTGAYPRAERFARRALSLHTSLLDSQGRADDLIHLANVRRMMGASAQAIQLNRAALRLNRSLRRRDAAARTLINLGSLFRLSGKYEHALKVLFEARHLYELIKSGDGLASTFNNIGSVYLDRGDLRDAKQFYRKAYNVARSLESPDRMAMTLGNLGIVYRKRGQYDIAMRYYREAYRINTRIENREGTARDAGNIGIAYLESKRLRPALIWLRKALRLNELLGKPEGVAINLQNIGIAYRRQRRFLSALKRFSKALKINERLGRPLGEADLLHNIGQVHFEMGHIYMAIRNYRKAYRINRDRGIHEGVAVVSESLGRAFLTAGNKRRASMYIQSSLSEYKKLGRTDKQKELGKLARRILIP